FGGIARLYGAQGLQRLRRSHVCVIGLGGVGSWAVEALARSGVGRLTLVDLDDICVSNINRQIHAVEGTVGKTKVEVMAARARAINPECEILSRVEFFTESTAAGILAEPLECVVDAIDSVRNKCLLIACSRERGIPIVVCGGTGGRRDATAVRIADLAQTSHDRLLQKVRERLRKEHGFPRRGQEFGVDCVYSAEAPVFPHQDGSVCATRPAVAGSSEDEPRQLNCESGLGSATFVTGTFGFIAASLAVRKIVEGV
ncbi:MAG: tRNA threonylcarbamoyladenosine dehydratase, partial [Verrucomicrobiales bacterium]|nr:tRNA threonylcarbamoyladenosine dehydratase [Verrucomicrobiales bacterium]